MLVLSRDIAIVLTVAIFNLAVARRTFKPSLLGKVATAVFHGDGRRDALRQLRYGGPRRSSPRSCTLTLAITLLSGFEYLYRMTRRPADA